MRNIFDQYSQPENRLTHALACCLNEDRKLLKNFIQWVLGKNQHNLRQIEILEQRLPGEEELTEDEASQRGLPDIWIHDGGQWSLIIESKVAAKLSNNQLRRHYETAQSRGFEQVTLLVIALIEYRRALPAYTIFKRWSDIYSWMIKQSQNSQWAVRTTQYMESAERRMITEGYLKEGTLTTFTGIPFDENNPYSYREAKRILRLALDELRKRKDIERKLGMNPNRQGRPAITGREQSSVWDFIPLKLVNKGDGFTKYPHLTLSIQEDRIFVLISVPNGIKAEYRKNLLSVGKEEFIKLFGEINKNLCVALSKIDGAAPWIELLQRHYPSQRSEPIIDAKLAFDLRTGFRDNLKRKQKDQNVKAQPVWLDSVYEAMSSKRGNMHLGIGAIFPYRHCKIVHKPEVINYIAAVWIACRPLLKRMLG